MISLKMIYDKLAAVVGDIRETRVILSKVGGIRPNGGDRQVAQGSGARRNSVRKKRRRAGSLRFLELQYQLINRRGIAEDDVGSGVLGMPQEVGIGDEPEPRGLDLRSQCLLSDPVKFLADRRAVFRMVLSDRRSPGSLRVSTRRTGALSIFARSTSM